MSTFERYLEILYATSIRSSNLAYEVDILPCRKSISEYIRIDVKFEGKKLGGHLLRHIKDCPEFKNILKKHFQ